MKYKNILATLGMALYLASPSYTDNTAYAGTSNSRVNATRISQSILDHNDSKKTEERIPASNLEKAIFGTIAAVCILSGPAMILVGGRRSVKKKDTTPI